MTTSSSGARAHDGIALTSRGAKTLVFFASGAVLMLEIIAGRLMAPYIGVSLETFTGVIGTMLAGIAVGASVGGRLADRRDPNGLIGPSLVIGGALSWLSLPILSVLGPGMGGDPFSIVLLTTLAFFAPATVLSAISPMVAKLQIDDLDESGSVVGDLSAAGTAGAIVGTFATGFILVAALPSRPVVLALGAALVVAGGVWTVRASGTRPPAMAVVFLLGTFGLGASSATPCQFETAYACASVVVDPDRPSGRSLVLDDLRHSYVDLDDPTFLDFRYFRLFADVVDVMEPAGAIDVLDIGGAGFAFPRYIGATRPGSTNLVLEIDEKLVEIAQDELGLVLSDDLQVIVGDARLALDDREDEAYDLVIGDAFSGRSVPWHLTTTEVVAEIRRMLRPDGIYMMNVIDGGDSRYARAQLATLREHFDHVAAIVPEGGVPSNRAVNQILLGSDAPLPALTVDPADGEFLDEAATLTYIDGAQVLRDDFAPVDQLARNF